MNNVIQLNVPPRLSPQDARYGALLASFALDRRTGDDVFWLKENAEVLNILECTGSELSQGALSAHQGFYDTVEQRLSFFPQYYRFLLSITLDLEDLGMPGNKGAQLVDWAVDQNLAQAELSDLQRMEARRLMARRGRDPLPTDSGLNDRVRDFINRSQTFTLPNKKAAYELTHAVFYLSEYGRHDPQLDAGARTSLHFAGLLAYLDQNADLLAEICVAMAFAGEEVPNLWTDWLDRETHLFTVTNDEYVSVNDDYHEFLVCHWHQAVTGAPIFKAAIGPGRMRFDRSDLRSAPLREISECMFRMEEARSGDWTRMRGLMEAQLSPEAMNVVCRAEEDSQFEAFFHGFARVDQIGVSA
ncbi:DUF6902 family protein [Puniceibacterium sediminis]|uniref:DUF6902 family protein n=1 Tax=Puniceibacterium sediminis TaxID=1608407 RepID=UPI000B778A81|nr:hypothetical protein [Puniceibacterium sediminis]